MTYYRLATHDHQTTSWTWKTTAVTSLEAVFQLLKLYGALPQEDLRVFTASSREDLGEMLKRQNANLPSGSVTATLFLRARNLAVQEQAHNAAEQIVSAATRQETTIVSRAKDVWEKHMATQVVQHEAAANPSSLPEFSNTTGTLSSLTLSLLDKKRLEIERGPGGDHDMPYLFTLPISVKESLAWARLLTRVHEGVLVP